jgi:hypothetical protein
MLESVLFESPQLWLLITLFMTFIQQHVGKHKCLTSGEKHICANLWFCESWTGYLHDVKNRRGNIKHKISGTSDLLLTTCWQLWRVPVLKRNCVHCAWFVTIRQLRWSESPGKNQSNCPKPYLQDVVFKKKKTSHCSSRTLKNHIFIVIIIHHNAINNTNHLHH